METRSQASRRGPFTGKGCDVLGREKNGGSRSRSGEETRAHVQGLESEKSENAQRAREWKMTRAGGTGRGCRECGSEV